MNIRRKNFSLLATALAGILTGENLFGLPNYGNRSYGDVPNPDTRQLREFNIKGKKVMAYSRKDAIKRIKHQSK